MRPEAQKPRSRDAEKPRNHRTSREAESRGAAGQAEKPRNHQASREAAKPRNPTNDANEMNERNKDSRPLQQSRKPA